MAKATRSPDIGEWPPFGEILKVIVKETEEGGKDRVYFVDARDRLGATLPGMMADRAQRYTVWKKERVDPPEPEQPMEDQDEDGTAAEEAEKEKQTAAETDASNETERKAEEEPPPDKPVLAEQEPKTTPPRRRHCAQA
jgi:hypothetical protein